MDEIDSDPFLELEYESSRFGGARKTSTWRTQCVGWKRELTEKVYVRAWTPPRIVVVCDRPPVSIHDPAANLCLLQREGHVVARAYVMKITKTGST